MKISSDKINQDGFSLLEILIAMAIMAILGGIIVGQYIDKTEIAGLQRIKADLAVIDSAVIQYKTDNFSFPTEVQGLDSLIKKPVNSPIPKNYPNYGYLQKLNTDLWGNPYQYRYPGTFGRYDIYSLGRDGEEGGEGLDGDIGNWNIDEKISSLKN